MSLGRWPEKWQEHQSYRFKEPTSTNNLEKVGRGFFPPKPSDNSLIADTCSLVILRRESGPDYTILGIENSEVKYCWFIPLNILCFKHSNRELIFEKKKVFYRDVPS